MKETPKPPKQKESKGKLKAPVMTDINTQKLFRQAVTSPSEYDGTKKEFTTWWSNMQLYLLGYASISDEGKIIAVLSREMPHFGHKRRKKMLLKETLGSLMNSKCS